METSTVQETVIIIHTYLTERSYIWPVRMTYSDWSEFCLIKRIKFVLITNIFFLLLNFSKPRECLRIFMHLWIKEWEIGENETRIPLGIFQSFSSQDGFGSGMNLQGFRRREPSSCSFRECVIWDFHLAVESSYLQSLFLETTNISYM